TFKVRRIQWEVPVQAPGNKQQALEKKHSSSANSAAGFGIWSLELFWSLELWAYSLGARRFLFLLLLLAGTSLRGFGVIRDGGIDPANLGKGDWIYATADATNKLGGHVNSVTNETSLMLFYKNQGIRYIVVKAGTGASLFNGCHGSPQFDTYLVNVAHANGILIFGYNRSYA